LKKFLVFVHLDAGEYSLEFDRPGEVERFVQGRDPEKISVFVQVTGLDWKNAQNMRSSLSDVALETALDQP